MLQSFQNEINTILEIGCGNGQKLNDLCQFFNANGYGVDPSSDALQNGNENYKDLKLSIAIASELPFENNSFDLVYFGFCLYLLDRNDLLKAVSEADRVLNKEGFLIIADFDPNQRHKRNYHHKSGLFSYKNNYADLFTITGHYYLVAKECYSTNTDYFCKNDEERCSVSILY